MGDFGKQIRLSRILRHDRGTLVVAFDHALILGPIPGTTDPAGQIRRLVEAKADAVLLNLGNIRHFADALRSGHVPGLIARLDWTTVNEHTSSAGEMVAAFAEENHLATIVGTKTPGRLLSGSAFKAGFGYIVGLPVAAYLTWQWKDDRRQGSCARRSCGATA